MNKCFPANIASGYQSDCWFVDDFGLEVWLDRLRGRNSLVMDEIGRSRDARLMVGLRVGEGRVVCTITAGAHADEPAGPMAAMLLAEWLSSDDRAAAELRGRVTFVICPQVNPDGAEANRSWFAPVPDFGSYIHQVKRELPGDDVEFGYPGDGKGALRPENLAVANYLSRFPAADVHCSLHSMAFAGGAWFLLGGRSIERAGVIRERLRGPIEKSGFGLHDIDRRGDKGFSRIGRGFCTTPDSRAMERHFNEAGDHDMAARFRLSSMEWTLSRNAAAHIMVTELPMFGLDGGFCPSRDEDKADAEQELDWDGEAPEPGSTAYEKFRDSLKGLMMRGDLAGAEKLAEDYGIVAIPFKEQCELMIVAVRKMVELIVEEKGLLRKS